MRQTHFQVGIKKKKLFGLLKHLKPPPALPVTDTFHSLLRLISHPIQTCPALTSPVVSAGEAVPGVPGGAVPAVPARAAAPGHPAVPADTDGQRLRAVPGQRRVPGTHREEEHGPRAGESFMLCS